MARHDVLTDLPNRVLLRERLEEAVAPGRKRREGRRALPRPRPLQGDQRHARPRAGDCAAKAVGRAVARLRGRARHDRAPRRRRVLDRAGGGRAADAATSLAARVIEAMSAPFELTASRWPSAPASASPSRRTTAATPTSCSRTPTWRCIGPRARAAAPTASSKPSMDADMQARRKLQLDLRKALSQRRVRALLPAGRQPRAQRDLRARGAAALASPRARQDLARQFIPVAEETGLIVPIGEWALRQACAEAAQWPEHIKVAVNLSPVQFKSRNLVEIVFARARRPRGCPPAAGARDHRVGAAARQRRHRRHPASAALARRAHRDGRLRHRLFELELSAQLPLRQDQDRPLLREGSRRAAAKARWRSCAPSPTSGSASAWSPPPRAWRPRSR